MPPAPAPAPAPVPALNVASPSLRGSTPLSSTAEDVRCSLDYVLLAYDGMYLELGAMVWRRSAVPSGEGGGCWDRGWRLRLGSWVRRPDSSEFSRAPCFDDRRAYAITDTESKEASVLTSGATAVTCLIKVWNSPVELVPAAQRRVERLSRPSRHALGCCAGITDGVLPFIASPTDLGTSSGHAVEVLGFRVRLMTLGRDTGEGS